MVAIGGSERPGGGHGAGGGEDEGGEDEQDEGGKPKTYLTDLALLLGEHEKAVIKESAAFKGITTFDDLLASPEKSRKSRMEAIKQVLADVATRHKQLWDAIGRVPQPGDDDKPGQELMAKVRLAARFTDDHLPDEFKHVPTGLGDVNPLEERLDTRLEAIADPEGKQDRIDALKKDFVNERGEPITAEIGKAYQSVIEPATLKPMDQARFYFDRLYVAQDPSKKPPGCELSPNEATELLVRQCQKILDNGGRFADVEELLNKTAIPKDWWPDKLVAEMQAWRKTESAMQRQRLADQWEKDNPNGQTQGQFAESGHARRRQGAAGELCRHRCERREPNPGPDR